MVRRRNASAPVRSAAPSPPPSARAAPPMAFPMSARPAAAPMDAAPPMAGAAPSQGPGLMARMAATAGRVAIGSAVGHTVGHMLTGGGGSSSDHAPAAAPAAAAPAGQQYSNPCEFEWKHFRVRNLQWREVVLGIAGCTIITEVLCVAREKCSKAWINLPSYVAIIFFVVIGLVVLGRDLEKPTPQIPDDEARALLQSQWQGLDSRVQCHVNCKRSSSAGSSHLTKRC